MTGPELDQLIRETLDEFGPVCLWWADRSKVTPELLIRALRQHGGHRGWRRARRIEEALRAAHAVPVRNPEAPRV